ncbi:MAG: NfeD family protein, partial [Opitutaceae bacterium]
GSAQVAGGAPSVAPAIDAILGRTGVAVTALFPSGQVEVDGRRHEARLEYGSARPGDRVIVRRRLDFGLLVEKEDRR